MPRHKHVATLDTLLGPMTARTIRLLLGWLNESRARAALEPIAETDFVRRIQQELSAEEKSPT